MELEPDPRMQLFIGGFDQQGQPLPFTMEGLSDIAAQWPTSEHTPEGVAHQLDVSRRLFIHSFFAYEFATVAASWSLIAVEASLRLALKARNNVTFQHLIKRAVDQGIVAQRFTEPLDAGRQLRNLFGHAKKQDVWSYGMVTGALRTSHAVIFDIFEPKSSGTDDDGRSSSPCRPG